MEWKIYYGDGMVFSSDDGPPEKAPGWGVAVIVQLDRRRGRMKVYQWGHYCWHGTPDGAWWGHDHTGLMDCLAIPGSSNIVLHGRTISQEMYARLLKRADADPDFPPPESAHPLETP